MKLRLRYSWAVLACALACGGDDGRGDDAATFPTGASNASVSATNPGDGSGDASSDTSDDDPSDTSDDDPSGPSDTTSGESDTSSNDFPACVFECTGDGDCTSNGMDNGFGCVAGRCAIPCVSNDSCVAALSFWMLEPCSSNAECEFGKCMPFDGMGGCAFGPQDLPCADVGLQAVDLPDITGATVTVCAQPTATCDTDGSCFVGCTAGGCGALTCGPQGKCVCDDDIQCYMAQLGERCDSGGQCDFACVSPADCPMSAFDGTQTLCE